MSYRVLIVDDSHAMQEIIRRIVTISGLEVSEFLKALNGNAALELLETNTVDLILTDVNMPECGGEEMMRRLKMNSRLRHIPVIVVSTDATRARVEQMKQLGAQGYISKPFTPEKLRSVIRQVLETSHA